jgi:hypothetical protein
MRRKLVVLSLVIVGSIVAQSQAPTPSPLNGAREGGRPEQISKSEQSKSETYKDTTSEWKSPITWFTFGLVLVGIAQVIVYFKQASIMAKSLKGSEDQSVLLNAHIAEAARQAKAMEDQITQTGRLADSAAISAKAGTKAADVVEKRTAQQMRAYLYVDAGEALFQEGATVFEGRPLLINGGFTPANKVSLKIRAAILPNPLPSDFVFKPPYGFEGSNILGPRQNVSLSAIVDSGCDDSEVEAVKRGEKKALYTWGTVTYEDIFDATHETEFCRLYIWGTPKGPIRGVFVAGHNNST